MLYDTPPPCKFRLFRIEILPPTTKVQQHGGSALRAATMMPTTIHPSTIITLCGRLHNSATHTCDVFSSDLRPRTHARRLLKIMPSVSSLLSIVGALLMAHAAYSTLHFRSILQDLGDVNEPIPPLDVYVELGVSFTMLLLGELLGAGQLQSVDVFAQNRKPLVAPAWRTRNFDIYECRLKPTKRA